MSPTPPWQSDFVFKNYGKNDALLAPGEKLAVAQQELRIASGYYLTN